MMVIIFLLMLVGGIGFAQVVSDPREVTLRWLRLGGIIAVALLAVLITIALMSREMTPGRWLLVAAPVAAFLLQLVSVQLAKRTLQRIAAGVGYLLATLAAVSLAPGQAVVTALGALLGGALLGGALMTMLLGHAYLTAGGEMTQKPFLRLVRWLMAALIVRLVLSLWTTVWPHLQQVESASGFTSGGDGMAAVWDSMLLVARYAVGLLVPAVFLYMTDDCVRRRANQSATGILYVTLVLLVIGEGAALALHGG